MTKIFKRLQTKEWLMMLISLAFIVAQVWLDLKVPDYMSEITQIVSRPGGEIKDILLQGGMMLLCTLGSVATSVIIGYFATKLAAAFSHRLRSDVFRRVESFSMEEMNGFSTASLITRTTNDITQIQMLLAIGLQVVIKAPIMAVWAVAKISTKNWGWTTLTGSLVALVVIMIIALMTYALPRFRRIQTLTDNLNRVTRENLTGIRVVRAYNAEGYQEEKFEEANLEFTKNNLSAHRAMQIMNPVMRLVMSGLSLGIYWIGAFLIEAAEMKDKIVVFSDMVVFSQYAMQVIMSFMMLTIVFIMLPRVMVSVNRVNEVLDTEPKILDGTIGATKDDHTGAVGTKRDGHTDAVGATSENVISSIGVTSDNIVSTAGTVPDSIIGTADTKRGSISGEVEFKNVCFKYPDAEDNVLHNISFKAKRGETVAFIGSTGSGKSTLINLVPRLYDATDGQVLVDGVNVKDYTQEALRNKLGYVPQRAVLFAGTVSSNVAFGNNDKPPASDEDIKRAVHVAQAAKFVENKEDGYNAHIAQGGTNVSGGQKQRLAIARAVCRKPEIYIFDDTFSALDYRTDRELRAALKRETKGTTSLIVAQRIGTIRDADRIIVLDEGEVVGMGTHNELMKTCVVYQEIAYSQLSKEELGA